MYNKANVRTVTKIKTFVLVKYICFIVPLLKIAPIKIDVLPMCFPLTTPVPHLNMQILIIGKNRMLLNLLSNLWTLAEFLSETTIVLGKISRWIRLDAAPSS